MAETKVDKRTLRTQEALRDALLELIIERGYEKSSVQDILDRASIGRATFYTHYRSKEDLLKRSLDVLHDHLIRDWKSSAKAGARAEAPLAFSLTFFRHVDGHRKLYRAIVGRESGAIVDRQMRRLLADLVKLEISSPGRKSKNDTRADMAAQYVVGALMSTVTWWLDRNIKLSPEQIDNLFREMTLPALQSFRANVIP